jgi:Zn-dependent peptidase ImmA (M78 family)
MRPTSFRVGHAGLIVLVPNSDEERRVNELASALLIPTEVVKAALRKLPVVAAALRKLARNANVSELAAAFHVPRPARCGT